MKEKELLKIVSNSKDFLLFQKWYNKSDLGIDINSFLRSDFIIQLGVYLKFIDDTYKVCINADGYSYVIYYSNYDKSPLKYLVNQMKLNNNYFIYSSDNKSSIMENYKLGIIKAFSLINSKPF